MATERERRELWERWRSLVNMTPSELRRFMDSDDGRAAGLSVDEARDEGVGRGRDSARALLRMIPKGGSFGAAQRNWTKAEWKWSGRQVSFISRMLGNRGPLTDDKGRKTRKLLSLLIWGHDPRKAKGRPMKKMNDEEFLTYAAEQIAKAKGAGDAKARLAALASNVNTVAKASTSGESSVVVKGYEGEVEIEISLAARTGDGNPPLVGANDEAAATGQGIAPNIDELAKSARTLKGEGDDDEGDDSNENVMEGKTSDDDWPDDMAADQKDGPAWGTDPN